MERQLDRARGILNLIIIVACLTAYAGFLIRTEATVLELFGQAMQLVDQENEREEIEDLAGEVRLNELLNELGRINDLTWIEPRRRSSEVTSARGQQGLYPELGEWLEDENMHNRSEVRAEELPPEFYFLFETDPRTLTARRLSARLQAKYDELVVVVGKTGSVREFHEAVSPTINLYGLDVSLSASGSMLVLVVASIALSLYLFSLLGSMAYEIKNLETRTGTDLIFFHPGRLSLVLSLLWVSSPTVVAVYNLVSVDNVAKTVVFCTVIATAVALATYVKVLQCRHQLFEKLATI